MAPKLATAWARCCHELPGGYGAGSGHMRGPPRHQPPSWPPPLFRLLTGPPGRGERDKSARFSHHFALQKASKTPQALLCNPKFGRFSSRLYTRPDS